MSRGYNATPLCLSNIYNCVKFAYHFRINYDLNLETAEFLELAWVFAILVKRCSAQGTNAHYV